jgi:hypothetical protein
MTATFRFLSPDERAGWSDLRTRFPDATVFTSKAYLESHSEFEILGGFVGDNLVFAFPLPIAKHAGSRSVRRTSYLSPYYQPLFLPIAGSRVHRERAQRVILAGALAALKAEFTSVALPLVPSVTDLLPFQRAHWQLELRHTYELPLRSLRELWERFEPSVHNHIRAASQLRVVRDDDLALFDWDQALFYEPAHNREDFRQLAGRLVAAKMGFALVALSESKPMAGAFIALDAQRAYNLLSYSDRSCGPRGAASLLIWKAAQEGASRGLQYLDMEGSVLPGVESFYHAFGGERRPYVQVHWEADEAAQKPILYYYD